MENKNNQIKFIQVKKQNFYTAHTKNGVILKSYNTIVGFLGDDGKLYRVRYSSTTGKQITQYSYNYNIREEIYTTAEKLHDIIFEYSGLDLNTQYNGAIYF